MTVTSVEYFELIKDYAHPNVERFVNDYKNGNKIIFPPFHEKQKLVSVIGLNT